MKQDFQKVTELCSCASNLRIIQGKPLHIEQFGVELEWI